MMFLTRRRLALLLLALTTVFLISGVPARMVLPVVPNSVVLEGVSGSVWRGQAARSGIVMPNGKLFSLGRVSWRLQPWSLLLLTPKVNFESQWGAQRFSGTAAASVSGLLRLEDVVARLDIGFTRQVLPLYVGGELEADIRSLAMKDNVILSLDGRVVLQDGVWAARAGDVALGTYVADLRTADEGTRADVQTLSGPLTVSGSAMLTGQDYSVDLALRGSALDNAGLRQSLQLLAMPSADGFDVILNGSL